MPRTSVVIPVYNNAESLRELVDRLRCVLTGSEYEILLVEDSSRDHSWGIIEQLASSDEHVKAFRLSRNFGQHAALSIGFEHASGDRIVLMDADLQDCPEDIPRLLDALEKSGLDVVYTVQEVARGGAFTRMTSSLYHAVISRLTRTKVPQDLGTFRAFTRVVLEALRSFPERNVLYGPLMFHMGFPYTVVTVMRDSRRHGKSSYSFYRRLVLALDSIVTYTDLPHRLLVGVGVGILIISALYVLVNLAQYGLYGAQLPAGITLIVLLLCMLAGVSTFSFGLIGIYVFRVYQEVLSRPRALIWKSLNVSSPRKQACGTLPAHVDREKS